MTNVPIKNQIANDIEQHIKTRNLQFWSTRLEVRNGIYCSRTHTNYTNTRVIAQGVSILVKQKRLVRVSKRRYIIEESK